MRSFNTCSINNAWVEYIKFQPVEMHSELFLAMFDYVKTGRKVKNPSCILAALYCMMQASINRRNAGKKGGAPKGNKNAVGTTQVQPKYNPSTTKVQPNVVDNQCVTEVLKNSIEKEQEEKQRKENKENKESKEDINKENKENKKKKEKEEKEISSPHINMMPPSDCGELFEQKPKEHTKEQLFIDDMKDRFPYVMKMRKPLQYSSFCTLRQKLMDEKYYSPETATEMIFSVLDDMENYSNKSKGAIYQAYIDAGKTLNKWITKRLLNG